MEIIIPHLCIKGNGSSAAKYFLTRAVPGEKVDVAMGRVF